MSNKKNKKKNTVKNNKKKIELSIGLIVKNEERCLEKCLQALKPLRDVVECEVVIADTGSTDKTKEIAGKYADILFDFEWVDDFSAARNAVMAKSSGRWYLSIDADEYMDESSVQHILSFLKGQSSQKSQCAYIIINNYTNKNDLSQYSSFYALRMVKLDSNARYEGRIHEYIVYDNLKQFTPLKDVVFWHDGYLNIKKNVQKKKGQRNIKLIKKEIEDNPTNILRYIQIIESSNSGYEKYEYVKKAIDLIEKKIGEYQTFAKLVYCHAVKIAYTYNYTELTSWVKECLEKYSNSLYTKVDVNYILVKYNIDKRNYKDAIKYAKEYIDAIKNKNSEKYIDDLSLSVLSYAEKKDEESILIDMAKAYAELGDYDKSKQIFVENTFENISLDVVDKWLYELWFLWDKTDISSIVSNILDFIYNESTEEVDTNVLDKKIIFEKNIEKHFVDDSIISYEKHILPFSFIAKFDKCELSYSAKIMLSDETNDIKQLLSKIDKWNNVPDIVLYKIVKFGIDFPEKFYQMTADELKEAAIKIINVSKYNDEDTIVSYLNKNCENVYDNLKYTLFDFNLCLHYLWMKDWKEIEDESYCRSIIYLSSKYSTKFLKLYYNENLFDENMIDVIPSMHGFAWILIQYKNSIDAGDLKKSIYWLKKSLKLAPNMKELVKNLVSNIEEKLKDEPTENVPQELLILAEKVRAILNGYPQDDPAVFAIKQSEVYKKVAHLIEKT